MTMTNTPFSLAGETALITGGGSGLGLGIAKCFVEAGAKVVLVGRREAELKSAAGELGKAATYLPHDITQVDQAASVIQRGGEIAGSSISILINNAGIHLKKAAAATSPAEFSAVLQTHVV